MAGTAVKPRAPIRRFDVFAEYNRLKGLKHGLDQARARGYGLWVAKVVASGGRRRAGRLLEPRDEPNEPAVRTERAYAGTAEQAEQAWHELGGEPQTDALFEREIVQRMGQDFYSQVFAPAIAAAFDRGDRYESIRDAIRHDWSPARP